MAPGIDVERDVLGRTEFRLVVPRTVEEMDRRLFAEGPMGLAEELRAAVLR